MLYNLDKILFEIDSFPKDVVHKYSPISDIDLNVLIKLGFPKDFAKFLRWSNGIEIFSEIVYGFDTERENLISVYAREHFEINNPISLNLFPFCPEGNGNYYCFDFNSKASIAYWNYNHSSLNNYEIVNTTFTEWLGELVDELKEEMT